MSFDERINITTGNLWLSIWQISWPMLLIMIFNFLVGMTDIYVAGFIGPEVQAVVGFVSQLFFLNIIIANAVKITCPYGACEQGNSGYADGVCNDNIQKE